MLNLGTKREFFWDDYLVDTARTTARFTSCEAVQLGTALELSRTYEQCISYPCIVKDDTGYKLYYVGYCENGVHSVNFCLLTSTDGIHWEHPNLGLVEYEGNTDNNILFTEAWDNLSVYYDENPDCPPAERYKAIGWGEKRNLVKGEGVKLWYYSSPDGIHFTREYVIHTGAAYDSLNTVHWDGEKYVCYFRGYHYNEKSEETLKKAPHLAKIMPTPKTGVRDVRVMYSTDFRNWTEAKMIAFDDGLDLPLYTNNVVRYPRGEGMLVGFPTRYSERAAWSPNYDRLPDPEERKESMRRFEPRSGLAITDCIFMSSRDGELWHRTNRAFMTPGYEKSATWVYGDCYPSYNFVDAGDENYYFYTIDTHHSFDVPSPLHRWRVRKDGFACREAYGEEAVLVTKPLTFDGGKLYLNFETSAMGHIFVDVLDADGNPISERSFELFGNNIDAYVGFADGSDFSAFVGKEVRLRFTMLDAKLYAMRFEK